jgi:hypothetical protein
VQPARRRTAAPSTAIRSAVTIGDITAEGTTLARVVRRGTWYPGPGLVRACNRPSARALRDEGLIAPADARWVRFWNADPRSYRGHPGASVTDRDTATASRRFDAVDPESRSRAE